MPPLLPSSSITNNDTTTTSMSSALLNLAIPLLELPLRPSSLQLFTKRGFETLADIQDSKAHGGIGNLAAELNVTLEEAAGYVREVYGCLACHTNNTQHIPTDLCFDDENDSNNQSIVDCRMVSPAGSNTRDNMDATVDSESPRPLLVTDDDYLSLGITTAHDLLKTSGGKDSPHMDHIVTFCKQIDNLLGGGIALGQVTEIAGMPGCGKTQLATQLSVLTPLIHQLGGVQGQTLYVDCEGSFLAERAYVMAEAASSHIRNNARRRLAQWHEKEKRRSSITCPQPTDDEAMLRKATELTAEEILESIQVFRVHDETALTATLFSLTDYVEERRNALLPVRLIVIDSIAFHFRAKKPDSSQYYFQRVKTLTSLASYLGDLAQKYNLAVVAINQMTTKVVHHQQPHGNGSSLSSSAVHVPALGESWAHATTTRLLLSNQERFVASGDIDDDNNGDDTTMSPNNAGSRVPSPQMLLRQQRTCTLVKSPVLPSGSADVPSSTTDSYVNKRRRTG